MAPLQVQALIGSSRKVHLFLLVLYASMVGLASATLPTTSITSIDLFGRRLLEQRHLLQESDVKKKSSATPNALATTISTTKNSNKTKLIKPTTTTAAGSHISANSTKNQTSPFKLVSSNKNSTKTNKGSSFQEKPISKKTNSTKPSSVLTQKSIKPTKKAKSTTIPLKKPTKSLGWAYQDDEEDDLVAGFRDLPSKLQETLLPDLEILSTTSKVYLDKANKEITNGFKPIVGKKHAPTVASLVSFAFILTPFLIVSLIFNQIKAYFSLQKLVIFIQIYLSIYFSILCLSSLVTGLEPLKFFYATSQSTYVCIQLLQTLAYVLYLVVLLMYFVLVFSTETGMGWKLVGLGQMFVGFAVGFHYYMTVFHRAVLRQPPKTSWKIHAIYATCFLLICLLGRAARRKKAYVVDGCSDDDGKIS